MTWYQILSLAGVPSFFGILIGILFARVEKTSKENNAQKLGIQALLRAQMIDDYNKWTEKGYAPIYARENFENCWKNYEALGENGVMNDIHGRFLTLPTSKEHDT